MYLEFGKVFSTLLGSVVTAVIRRIICGQFSFPAIPGLSVRDMASKPSGGSSKPCSSLDLVPLLAVASIQR